ncbi:MAG: polyribonucleotide nucleotidyltransferase, partial [Planctomycetaceae bacterium]|nr:polyribonucleotide nucleotidyltransferase [Planctomycetaceae bacterium]
MKVRVEKEIAGRTLSLTTGQIAKQASGAVILQYGDTMMLIAAQTGPGRPGIDFFPLTVDYRERVTAAGKFPGGFLKREGRPTDREILAARLTDRPIRPLFPKSFTDEVQVQINVLSYDGENEPDVWAINGASAALSIAPLPFQGPIAGVRVGMIDGEFVLFPTCEQLAESSLDLIVAGSMESILMIEGFGNQIPEEDMVDALMFGHKAIRQICELQTELVKKTGKGGCEYEAPTENPFVGQVKDELGSKLRDARQNPKKQERSAAAKAVRDEYIAKLFPDGTEQLADGRTLSQLKEAIYKVDNQICRQLTLEGKRLDGRDIRELRQVDCEVDVIPRIHGSALFTRGETQSLASLVLGSVRDQQRVDGLNEEIGKSFMLHYNFPSYSVGEVRPIRGPGRREIGHGMLAERSVAPVLPKLDKFPYTI